MEANKKSQQRLARAQETAIGRGQRSTIGDKSVGDLGVDFVGIHCGKIGHVRGGKFLFISSATGYCFAQRRGAQGCCFLERYWVLRTLQFLLVLRAFERGYYSCLVLSLSTGRLMVPFHIAFLPSILSPAPSPCSTASAS